MTGVTVTKRVMTTLLLPLVSGCGLGQATAAPSDEGARTESLSFVSEGVTLAGTLSTPPGPGPHPAMVYVHGSGRVTRGAARGVASHFNGLGIAVFAYDKRGVGESGGVYVGRQNASEANLTLLARDAAAAIDALRRLPSIDPEQIGLWGVSQAGWIVPVAAILDGRTSFTVLISGPTVTVGEENYYSALTGDSRSGLAALDQEEISRLLAERGPSGFDPEPYLRRMDAPGLWLLGSADESIPIPETVRILDTLIEDLGRPFAYRVWEGADHSLRVDGRTVPGFWAAQDRFLFDEVGVRVVR